MSRFVLTLMFLTALALPATAGMRDTPLCKAELAAASASLGQSSARVQRAGNAKSDEACIAYQTYFLEAVKARSVAAQCKTGPEREQDLGRLDVSVEQANNGIAARCG
ncbi:MAG TPA: hypothetical protein VJL90_13985 [Pseudorhodoplanes sp.]|nr:hypothetical protein [Pseudorhodoplanes sp.]